MKKHELELLVKAGNVERVVICREWLHTGPDTVASASLWEVWAYGGEATRSLGNVVLTARGDRRWFRTLDTAYGFVRGVGFRGEVVVEDRSHTE